MGYNQTGRARVNPRHPEAFAVCDTCGFWWNHAYLSEAVEYQGNSIRKTGFLVCRYCNDIPQPQLSTPILPPDPVPVRNPRPDLSNQDAGWGLASSSAPCSSQIPVSGLPE